MTDNPATAQPQPPQREQQQSPPGRTTAMNPRPDHGEESYKGSGKLAGKAALITGADSGIGRAVAIAFAREGADILISYLEEHHDARETAKWVEKAGKTGGVDCRTPAGGRCCRACPDIPAGARCASMPCPIRFACCWSIRG